MEIFASTKAYPSWWSDVEEHGFLQQRKRGADEKVLERNICFVDTPGFEPGPSAVESMERVLRYVESQVERNTKFDGMTDTDLQNLLGGSGGSQVDLVLYLFEPGTSSSCNERCAS